MASIMRRDDNILSPESFRTWKEK